MIEVRLLRQTDDRSGFCSGDPDLDRFFILYAGQNQFRHHIGTTYVAVENDEIKGFATVSASTIKVDELSAARKKRLPQYPLPVLRLARLAVSEPDRNRGIGLTLLRSVFYLAREMSEKVGCTGVVVDAKPDAVDFYMRFGFEKLEVLQGTLADRPEPIPMFIPLGAIPV
jgi:predicted N-acetyltransferase YhbS